MSAITVVYLFQAGESDLYALSIDKTGCNIPRRESEAPWLLRATLSDGDQHELDFKAPLRELERKGYCVLFIKTDD